jgi:transposase
MEKPQEQPAAKVQFVAAMQRGLSWQEAREEVGICLSRSTVFRLRQRVHLMGAEATQDGRHGHPAKLRGEVRQWLEETCQQVPHTPSHEVQSQLAERFSLTISVSQINRVRAMLGVSNPPQSAKKK